MVSSELLSGVSAVWIALGLMGSMLLVHELAFRRGNKVHKAAPPGDKTGGGLLDSALSLLLGLFLAFSFSLAAGRYESRQDLVIAESNAIGTAFLRCDLMADEPRQQCRKLLRDYTDLRIKIYLSGDAPQQLRSLVRESEKVQLALWNMATQMARSGPTTSTSLILQGLNEVIDRHGERVAAYRRHVHAVVTGMLLGLCLIWAIFNGYSQGIANRRNPLGWPAFALLVSIVIYIILDFDRQGVGLIQLDASQSLYDLRKGMN